MFPAYRQVILQTLARSAGLEDLERRIVVEHALTPTDIHRRIACSMARPTALPAMAVFSGRLSPATAVRMCRGCTSLEARHIRDRACRWC